MPIKSFSSTLRILVIVGSLIAVGCTTTQSPKRQVSDLRITTEVKSRLAADLHASSLADIEVNTTNGVVTLAGQVETSEMKRAAGSVALAVPGVVEVNNNLQTAEVGLGSSR